MSKRKRQPRDCQESREYKESILSGYHSPIGTILCMTEDGKSTSRVELIKNPSRTISFPAENAWLKAYFNSSLLRPTEFPVSKDVFDRMSPFQARVLRTLYQVPFGKTVTYRQLAEMMEAPKAARAVGNALNRNPFPIVIPCHRVLRSDGVGDYALGREIKEWLIGYEQL